MSLALSSADLTRLNAAASALLSPFSFESGAAWRRESCQAIERLVGATRSISVAPLDGNDFWGGDDEVINAFVRVWPPPDWILRGHTERRAALRLDVADWTEIFDDVRQVRASEFYETVVRPNNLWAPVSIYAELPQLQPSYLWGWQLPEKRPWILAFLTFYFSDETSALRALEWRRAALQLLVPAVQSGMRAFVHTRRLGARFAQLIDELDVPVAICRPGGAIEHQNAALTTLLGGDADRELVREAVRQTAQSVTALLGGQDKACAKGLHEIPRTEVRTRRAVYGVYATIIEAGAFGLPNLVLIVVERRFPSTVTKQLIASWYRLTPRETEVLELLRRGASTRGIADTMHISVNTARRHIERSLTKLGVHSRMAAMALLAPLDD